MFLTSTQHTKIKTLESTISLKESTSSQSGSTIGAHLVNRLSSSFESASTTFCLRFVAKAFESETNGKAKSMIYSLFPPNEFSPSYHGNGGFQLKSPASFIWFGFPKGRGSFRY